MGLTPDLSTTKRQILSSRFFRSDPVTQHTVVLGCLCHSYRLSRILDRLVQSIASVGSMSVRPQLLEVQIAEPVVESNCQPAPSMAQCLAKRSCQGLGLSAMRIELNGLGCRADTLTTTESSALSRVDADENGRDSTSMVNYKQRSALSEGLAFTSG